MQQTYHHHHHHLCLVVTFEGGGGLWSMEDHWIPGRKNLFLQSCPTLPLSSILPAWFLFCTGFRRHSTWILLSKLKSGNYQCLDCEDMRWGGEVCIGVCV